MIDKSNKLLLSYLYLFLTIICCLIIIGFIFIYSSSSIYALEKTGVNYYYLKKQIIGSILGCIGLAFFKSFRLSKIKKFTPIFFLISWILTLLTLVPHIGTSIHGSKRWITLFRITLQPSELLKVSFILYIAFLLNKKQSKMNSFWQGYAPLLLILLCTSIILLKQPDFGQTVTLISTAFFMFFLSPLPITYLLKTIIPLIPLAGILVYTKPYRFKRILTFLNPWNDPQGSGFQIIQSLISIGSGHIKGLGIAQSKQKFFYLPMQHTDFIFSIIAEETGFIGVTAILLCYILFTYIGFTIAKLLKDTFSHYIVLGFTTLTSLQALINIFVASGLAPTKGLGLPFISYGNSALIANMCILGIIINAVQTQAEQEVILLKSSV